VSPRLTFTEPEGEAPASAAPRSVDLNDPELDERTKVIAALEQAGWVQAKAARLLGMTPRQIAYRIQILNIEVKQF
jgi:Nif-specific regulatory protein